MFDTFAKGVSTSAWGVQKRLGNTTALTDLWLTSPIWGNGLNAYANESLASNITKWSYEVFYNALLAQVGIIGVLIFAIGVFHIMKNLSAKYMRTQSIYYLSVLVGFICFLLCGASNPLVYVPWPWIIALSFSMTDIEYDDAIV